MTREEYLAKCKADVCNTQSRSKNGKKYTNKYTQYFGKKGYKGINSKGVFTKTYSYGVVGHCCIGAQYHLHKNGLSAFVPKSKGYIWNTNVYANWLKSKPTISGYGKVGWTTDPSKAKKGDIVFKGTKGKSGYTHTCIFDHYANGYVYTVDFNVSGKKNGKTYNNGLVHKRKKSSYKWGIALMPFPKLSKYEVNTKSSPLNIRTEPSTSAKIVGRLPKGEVVFVESIKGDWAYLPKYNNIYGGYCSTKYLKKA